MDSENSAIHEKVSNFLCGNCNTENSNGMESTCVIQIENMTNSKGIEIRDALSYIYGISWNTCQKHLTLEENNDGNTNATEIFDSQTVFFCPLCATLLTDIYKAHCKLDEATNSLSVIEKMKSTREKILNSSCVISDGENINGFQSDSATGTLSTDSNEKLMTFSGIDEETDTFSVDIKCEAYENYEMDENNDWNWGEDEGVDVSENLHWDSKREIVVKIERLSIEELHKYGLKADYNAKGKITGQVKVKAYGEESGKSDETDKKEASANVSKEKEKIVNAKTVRKTKKHKNKPNKFRKRGAIKRVGEYFLCPICNKRFTSVSYILKEHMDTHTKDMSCHLCTKILGSRKSLRYHVKIFHNQGNLKRSCQVCGKLVHIKSLEKHMAAHENPVFKCVRCGEVYLDRKIYDEHRLTYKKNTVPFLCRLCGRIFNTKQACFTHEQRHTGERKFACDQCPAKSYTQKQLDLHQIVHLTERSLVCEHCGKDFKSRVVFRTHLNTHKDEAENGQYSYNCDLCGRMCKNRFSLTRHKKKWHGEKKFECSFCGKRVLRQRALKHHENLHRANPDYVPRKPKIMQNKPISFQNADVINCPLSID